ncbi:MAG: NUDIX domain-containing protein [Alphaproteobacteria bacterium]|nr:NUDIX domain-containing protein [Alphaproteobacteria bacterium]
MSQQYFDRNGKLYTLSETSKRRPRSGAFGIARAHNKYLLLWSEEAPDTPEVPGGGIDEGEDVYEALVREFYEETGVQLPRKLIPATPFLDRVTPYYALCDHEFWDYHQRYFFINDAEAIYFEGARTTPENGKAAWLALDEIAKETMHAAHKQALDILLQKIGG